MRFNFFTRRLLLTLTCLLLPLSVLAQPNAPKPGMQKASSKEGNNYAFFGLAMNEFRSVRVILVSLDDETGEPDPDAVEVDRFPMTAQSYSLVMGLGTYITDLFKTELRFGTGVRSDDFLKSIEVKFNYYFNWYIGPTFPVTDYLNAYFMYGISFYDADVTWYQTEYQIPLTTPNKLPEIVIVQPSPKKMHKEFFDTKFSTSWLLGVDYHLFDRTYLGFEYGRLLRDTDTNIKVYQANLLLRYEF